MPEDQITMDLMPMVGHPFAHFVEVIQQQTTVEFSLQHLQERHALPPVLLLYFIWFGLTAHGRLRRIHYRRLLEALSHWHAQVVNTLQCVEQLVATSRHAASTTLRGWLLTELNFARLIECRLLTDAVVSLRTFKRNPTQCLNDACSNLVGYAKMVSIHFSEDDQRTLCMVLQAIFVNTDPAEIANALQYAFTSAKMNAAHCAQLSLEIPFQ